MPAAMLKRLFQRDEPPARVWRAPPGERLYAIGDVHGRLDLLDALLARIAADGAARAARPTRLVLVGDLVDRGPASAQVVARAMTLVAAGAVCLKGNHEELMLETLAGDRQAAGVWVRNGGRETLLSYGVDPHDYEAADLGGVIALAQVHVPADHRGFLERLPDHHQAGDYLFVHAGIRPGRPLEEQRGSDLRWIRRHFLDSEVDHGACVVHGHSIVPEVEERPNRLGLDTGAFASGILTAVGLEDDRRWFLATA